MIFFILQERTRLQSAMEDDMQNKWSQRDLGRIYYHPKRVAEFLIWGDGWAQGRLPNVPVQYILALRDLQFMKHFD